MKPNITVLFHENSIPGDGTLSRALSGLNITLPVPAIHIPSDDDDSDPNNNGSSTFLRSATIHLLSSTAQFTLLNPLSTPLSILSLAANATYQSTLVGSILEPDLNYECPLGESTTDKLAVEVGDVGYGVIRRALGGELNVDAVAEVVIGVGGWRGRVFYKAWGLGAKIRL
jgi:hypothetical protein